MAYIKYGSFDFAGASGYPVPQISLSVEQERDGAGKSIGSRTIVNLEGFICASGNDGFTSLVSKESGLREAFRVDGSPLVIGCTGTGGTTIPYFTGYPKVNKYTAEKTDNYWINTIAYSIELEIINTGTTGGPCSSFGIASAQDDWNIETIDELSYVNTPVGASVLRQALSIPIGSGYPTYRVSRTLGAVGKYIPTGSGTGISAIKSAKDWVLCNATGNSSLTGVLSGLTLYNFTRSINVSEIEGSYRITDNWIAVPSGTLSGGYTESYNVESSLDNSYLRTVTINGTIKGLEPFSGANIYASTTIGTGLSGSIYPLVTGSNRTPSTSKFDKALSGYTGIKNELYNRASCFLSKSGDPTGIFRRFFNRDEPILNPLPLSITEGFNPTDGTVTYSWVYNNRPLNLVSGSISEVLTVNDNFPTQQVAEIFVLGRRLGPILQDLGTYTTASREVTFEVTMLRPTGLSGLRFPKTAYSAITGAVEALNPSYLLGIGGQCKAFVKSNTENWNVSEGRFVKTKSWLWTKCDDIVGANPSVY